VRKRKSAGTDHRAPLEGSLQVIMNIDLLKREIPAKPLKPRVSICRINIRYLVRLRRKDRAQDGRTTPQNELPLNSNRPLPLVAELHRATTYTASCPK